MIRYMYSWDISQSSSVKIRSHLGAITEDLIDYVKPTKNNTKACLSILVPMTLQIKSKSCRN